MYQILRSAHSGWRYVVLILLVLALIQALAGWFGKKPYTEGNRKLNVFALIATHIQILVGLVMYFISPLVEAGIRYWKMEHIGMMIFAAILVTVGNARSKRGDDGAAKHRTIAIYFGLALIVIVAAILAMTKVDPTRSFFGIS
ncbi:cytochrome B [Pedobacter psychroterrae]|uniref:Cytochrome B n=1 Tax=Pedobacter psychroterrae TaxID=2530453 RepID=A0A4R0NPH4_9SPHI|nr:cytochrome B [Pedobacter psychroterrae]TCD02910.1 cytochrome B [Pedobacter psychroterrae]